MNKYKSDITEFSAQSHQLWTIYKLTGDNPASSYPQSETEREADRTWDADSHGHRSRSGVDL